MTVFKLPDLGEGLPDAEIREWHVAVGDEVKTDQPIVSMETAKAVVEVPAPHAGVIKTLFGDEGDIIETGAPLVEFEAAAGASADANEAAATSEAREDTGTVAGNIEVGSEVIEETAIVLTRKRSSSEPSKPVLPAVRDLAHRLGVDLTALRGTGRNGMISIADVQKAAKSAGGAAAGQTAGDELPDGESLQGSRRIMAQTMAKSHAEVVPVSVFDRAVLDAWDDNVDITCRLIRAIVTACKAEPALNAAFSGQSMRRQLQDQVNLGLAMDTEEGLFVPVLRDVGSKLADMQQLRDQLNTVKQQMRDRSIPQEDLQGATITLSNFGVFAGKYATPVVVQPQVAIIACGKMHDEVVAKDGLAIVTKVMPLSITFDHRAATGGEATRFMSVLLEDLQKRD